MTTESECTSTYPPRRGITRIEVLEMLRRLIQESIIESEDSRQITIYQLDPHSLLGSIEAELRDEMRKERK